MIRNFNLDMEYAEYQPTAYDYQFAFIAILHDIAAFYGYQFSPPMNIGDDPLEMSFKIGGIKMRISQDEALSDSLFVICEYGTVPSEIRQQVLSDILLMNVEQASHGGSIFCMEHEPEEVLLSIKAVALSTACASTMLNLLSDLAKRALAWKEECQNLIENSEPNINAAEMWKWERV
jgi:hypothetical protein